MKHRRKPKKKQPKIGKILAVLAVILIIIACVGIGYFLYTNWEKGDKPTNTDTSPETNDVEPVVIIDDYSLRMGAWNIQILGKTKIEDQAIMATVEKVISTYDLLAIQEVRDSSTATLDGLSSRLPANYSMEDSPRLGRSSSKEQYVFIWDNRDFELKSIEVYPDANDKFEREPYMGLFEIKGNGVRFVAMVCHVKPTDAYNEIAELQTVVEYAKNKYATNNIIVMGDLNADCSYYSNTGQHLTTMNWMHGDFFDTTVAKGTDCAYDRIVISKPFANAFEYASMYRFDIEYGLTNTEALDVSDHYPVFADYIIK